MCRERDYFVSISVEIGCRCARVFQFRTGVSRLFCPPAVGPVTLGEPRHDGERQGPCRSFWPKGRTDQPGSELCEARGPALGRTRPAVGAHPELRAAAQQRADVEPETRSKVRTSRRKHAFKQYVQVWLPMLSAVPIRSVICVCFYFTFT